MKEKPINNNLELVKRFGRIVAENYVRALQQLNHSLGDSEAPADKDLRKFLAPLSNKEREIKIAEVALEFFIHDFMASLDESNDFKILGTLKDGSQVDLRDLCPEGLHGNQLDWIDNFANHKSVFTMIFEKDFL